MKLKVGGKYRTRNGSIAKVESVGNNGLMFYGTINDDGDLVTKNWAGNGLTFDGMINHPYELMYEVKFMDIALGRVFGLLIDVFAFSLLVVPVLILFFSAVCLWVVAFNLLFK